MEKIILKVTEKDRMRLRELAKRRRYPSFLL